MGNLKLLRCDFIIIPIFHLSFLESLPLMEPPDYDINYNHDMP